MDGRGPRALRCRGRLVAAAQGHRRGHPLGHRGRGRAAMGCGGLGGVLWVHVGVSSGVRQGVSSGHCSTRSICGVARSRPQIRSERPRAARGAGVLVQPPLRLRHSVLANGKPFDDFVVVGWPPVRFRREMRFFRGRCACCLLRIRTRQRMRLMSCWEQAWLLQAAD